MYPLLIGTAPKYLSYNDNSIIQNHWKMQKLVDLVHYEIIEGMAECIQREKQLKNWHREWKINLIKEDNPEIADLAAGWYAEIDGRLVIKSGWHGASL